MHLDYLRNNKKVTYSGHLLSGKLKEHIEDIDRQTEEMFSRLVEQMKPAEASTNNSDQKDRKAFICNKEITVLIYT